MNKYHLKSIFKVSSLVLILAIFCFKAETQERYVIEAGSSIADVIPIEEIHKYPEFMLGVVHHKDRTVSEAMLNYSYIISEMVFINGRDTLAIDNANTIDYIVIATDTFIYSGNDYLQHISGNGSVELYEKVWFKLADIKQKGAYGISSSTTSADNLTSVTTGGPLMTFSNRLYDLKVSQELVYTKRREYYLKDKSGEVVPARRRNFLNIYPDSKKEISDLVKEQSIRFNEKDDLISLVNQLKGFD